MRKKNVIVKWMLSFLLCLSLISADILPLRADDAVPGSMEVLSDSGESEASQETDNEPEFMIQEASLMYGEDGSNLYGNLDALFQPCCMIDGKELIPGKDYTTEYRFLRDGQTVELSEVPAGTSLTMLVTAHGLEAQIPDISLTKDITVAKRRVSIRYIAPKDFVLDSKEADEKGLYTLSEMELGSFAVTAEGNEEGSQADEEILSADQVVSGKVTYDLSGVQVNEDGWLTLPVEAELSEEFRSNYEVKYGIFGDAYTLKPRYYVSFSAENEGKQSLITLEIPKGTSGVKVEDFLRSQGKLSSVVPDMGGAVDGNEASILGWIVRKDGKTPSNSLDNSFGYNQEEYDSAADDYKVVYTYYTLSYGTDYYLEASIAKHAADHLYVENIPAVPYIHAAHVSNEETASSSKAPDLNIRVYGNLTGNGDSTDYHLLTPSEYTISYKNNTNISMKLDEEGRYVPVYTKDTERPKVIITGKGSYKGFSAQVYFDILPTDLCWTGSPYSYDKSDYHSDYAQLGGLKNSYALNDKGQINGRIKLTVTKEFGYYDSKWNNKSTKVTLKSGTDYVPALYRWNNSSWEQQSISDPSLIDKAGDYLYVIRGIGNYCGSAYGNYSGGDFDDGLASGSPNPAHFSFTGTAAPSTWQFRVTNGDAYWDLSNATINIKKASIKYNGLNHGKEDFGLTVTIGKGKDIRELREGIDYKLTLTSDRYPEEYTDSDGKVWVGLTRGQDIASTNGSDSPARIRISNQYSIRIDAIEGSGYYGTISTKKKLHITGIALNPSYFDCGIGIKHKKSAPFDGSNYSAKYYLTKKGIKAGLSTYPGTRQVGAVASSSSMAAPGTYTSTLYAIGEGVDHSTTATKKGLTIGNATLQSVVDRGWLTFSLSEGTYNVKGSYPTVTMRYRAYDSSSKSFVMRTASYTPTYNNYPVYASIAVGSASAYYLNTTVYTPLLLQFSSNTKAGGTAVMTVKAAGRGGFTGVIKRNSDGSKLTYTIAPREINYTIPLLSDSPRLSYGRLYAVVNDESSSKGNLEKPKVTLYQAYYKNQADYRNGKLSTEALKSSQYLVSGTKINDYTSDISILSEGNTLISGFDFGDGVKVNAQYHVYDTAAKITSAKIVYKGQEYEVDAKQVPEFPFEGIQLRFDRRSGDGVKSVTLSDGTVLSPNDFDVTYGTNINAGKKAGSFTIQLKYNTTSETWLYHGKAEFKFDIKEKGQVVL